MTTFQAVLAAAIIITFLIQIVVLFLMYRVLAKTSDKANKLMDTVEPQIRDLGEGVRASRKALEVATAELRATLSGVRAATTEIKDLVQTEGRELARLIDKVTFTTERQIEQADQQLDRARMKLGEIGGGFDRSVLEPVRVALAAGVAVRRGIEAIFNASGGRRRSNGPY